VGWGVLQRAGVFPGRGLLKQRPFTEEEQAALGAAASGHALDVYLNETTFWSGIPQAAWDFKIGGFQVLKKWLSYREHGPDRPSPLLGRGLTISEAREFARLAQRLTAVVALGPALDANYLSAAAMSIGRLR